MKNANSSTGGGGSRRRVRPAGLPLINGRRKEQQTADSDQDLFLFRELHKRERDRNMITLLQPVSDEFEPNGNYQLYRIASAKKGSGFEFPAENEKNDYDWLKTPPATPLFPSLEMDANGPQLIIQREIPVLQPLSRFAAVNCNLEAVDDNSNINGGPIVKSSNSRSRDPQRSVITPSSQRTRTLSHSSNQTKNTKTSTIIRTDQVPILDQQKAINSNADHNDMIIMTRKPNPTTTRKNGAISPLPLVPSTNSISAGHGFSNEKPPNLRTHERSNSATRDQSARAKSTEPRRPQSSSSIASASRGRKVVVGCSTAVKGSMPLDDISCGVKEGNLINTSSPKGIRSINQTGNGTQVAGSRMVQRVVNARSKAAAQPALVENYKKQSNDRGRFPVIQTTGFGIMAPKKSINGYNSKHMVVPK